MNAIGTSVLGGMITGTLLVVLFAPLFYVLIEKTFAKRKAPKEDKKADTSAAEGASKI